MSGAKKYSLIINGQKLETSNFHEVHNPSNGDIVGLMPVAGQTELDLQSKWHKLPFLPGLQWKTGKDSKFV